MLAVATNNKNQAKIDEKSHVFWDIDFEGILGRFWEGFGRVLGGQNPRFLHIFRHFFDVNFDMHFGRRKNRDFPQEKIIFSWFRRLRFCMVCFKNDFEKTSKKVRKSRILASQTPPKTKPKSCLFGKRRFLKNRAPAYTKLLFFKVSGLQNDVRTL